MNGPGDGGRQMIRPYRPEDLHRIVEIGNRAWQSIYAMFRETHGEDLFRLLIPSPETHKGKEIARQCEAHPDWTLVYEEQGRAIGFIQFTIHPAISVGQIQSNAVDPECTGRGIGRQLYASALRRFRREGMRYAMVTTGLDEAHGPALRAYERAGFNIRHEEVRLFKRL